MVDKDILANSDIFKIAEEKYTSPATDAEFDKLFTVLAKEHRPEKFSEFQEKVASLFNNKLDSQFERWGQRLALDRTKLKDLFLNQS